MAVQFFVPQRFYTGVNIVPRQKVIVDFLNIYISIHNSILILYAGGVNISCKKIVINLIYLAKKINIA